jgi:hypothetical protein
MSAHRGCGAPQGGLVCRKHALLAIWASFDLGERSIAVSRGHIADIAVLECCNALVEVDGLAATRFESMACESFKVIRLD